MANTPEQNKVELEREFAKVEQKQRDVESQKLVNANTLGQAKSKLIGEMFGIMEQMGVDMSNMESISGFLQKLQKLDPDLHELFEYAFNGLVQEQEVAPTPQPVAEENGPNLMDKYQNLSGDIMRGQ